MESTDLLIALKDTLKTHELDRQEVLRILEAILLWLNENNTDENCRRVDTFVSTGVDLKRLEGLGEEIAGIIWDMGGALHDTHTDPDVASNFFSTPPQLLERLRRIQAGEQA